MQTLQTVDSCLSSRGHLLHAGQDEHPTRQWIPRRKNEKLARLQAFLWRQSFLKMTPIGRDDPPSSLQRGPASHDRIPNY